MVKKMNRRSILFLVVCASLAFYSCEEPSAKLESKPISDINFNYLQSSKKFFVSALVNSRYMDSALDSVEVFDQKLYHPTLSSEDSWTLL